MDGFKNSTKTQYSCGGKAYAKGGSVKGAAKVSKVMGEFKSGTLHSGSKSGPEVTNRKQAVAIALSEARKAGAKVPVKKAAGGPITGPMQPEPMRGPQLSPADQARADSLRSSVHAMRAQNAASPSPELANKIIATRNKRRAILGRPALQAGGYAKGGLMDESTSARPVKVGPTPEERATRATLRRAERVQAEEANESRIARETRKATPRTREVTVERRMDTERSVRTPLDERLSRPVPAAEMRQARRGPGGAGFSVKPLVDAARGALGLKGGGLATMPRGKKC